MRATLTGPMTLALLLACACDNAPVAVRPLSIEQERATWASHRLTRYAYVYEVTGFFISFEGRRIRLVVLNDSVASAQDLTTDSLLPVTSAFPTIDGLFDRAAAALAEGTLAGITFDPTFGYPSSMALTGPPDASGSVLASDLELLP